MNHHNAAPRKQRSRPIEYSTDGEITRVMGDAGVTLATAKQRPHSPPADCAAAVRSGSAVRVCVRLCSSSMIWSVKPARC